MLTKIHKVLTIYKLCSFILEFLVPLESDCYGLIYSLKERWVLGNCNEGHLQKFAKDEAYCGIT